MLKAPLGKLLLYRFPLKAKIGKMAAAPHLFEALKDLFGISDLIKKISTARSLRSLDHYGPLPDYNFSRHDTVPRKHVTACGGFMVFSRRPSSVIRHPVFIRRPPSVISRLSSDLPPRRVAGLKKSSTRFLEK